MWPKLKKNPEIPIFIRCLTLISLTQQKYKVDKFIACKMFEMYFQMVFLYRITLQETCIVNTPTLWLSILNTITKSLSNDI